ncbi:MAG: hypothetical protein IH986_04555 [Planctomycetes bacterium]|nr:hypothetical protein [Planctomycetota bacterium]
MNEASPGWRGAGLSAKSLRDGLSHRDLRDARTVDDSRHEIALLCGKPRVASYPDRGQAPVVRGLKTHAES